MNDIVFLLINGITVACIYGLVAVAVSITWSALGLLNLSYGFIFSFAGYGAWLAERHLWGVFANSLGHWLRGSASFVQSVVSHGVLDVWLSGHAMSHSEKGLHFNSIFY